MAFSREARPPFLDPRLVQFAFSLPSDLKIRGAENKRVPRVYASGIVPPSIVGRTDKMGFVSPQQEWQRGVLKFIAGLSDDEVREATSFGTQAERDRAVERYRAYADGYSDEWAFAWRVFCLARWLELSAKWMA